MGAPFIGQARIRAPINQVPNQLARIAQTIQQGQRLSEDERQFNALQAFRQQQADIQQQNALARLAQGAQGLALRRQEAERATSLDDLRRQQLELGIERAGLENEALRNPVQQPFESVKDRASVESGLRKEFSGLSKDFRTVRDAFGRVEASAQDPSAAGDLALVFSYMKILDPGSVVRESEFANAQNAAGVPDRVRNAYNRVLSGERLSPGQRRDFTNRAQRLFSRQNAQFEQLAGQFRGIGERLGVDVENVIPDFGLAEQPDEAEQVLNAARDAIQRGADPEAVRQRLVENGIDAGNL